MPVSTDTTVNMDIEGVPHSPAPSGYATDGERLGGTGEPIGASHDGRFSRFRIFLIAQILGLRRYWRC